MEALPLRWPFGPEMTPTERKILGTGISHLDEVLGGGVPEGDVLLVIGPPGSGKTTLAFQLAFHAAARGDHVVYVSTLSEPGPRLLKHQRTFSFWNEGVLGKRLFLESIFPVVKHGVGRLTDALVDTVRAHDA